MHILKYIFAMAAAITRDCREMSKKFFGFSNELIDKVIGIS